MAWCYSDLSVAISLLHASNSLGSAKLRKEADRILYRGIEKFKLLNANIDASLCHGTAGVAHMLNRYYQFTGDTNLKKLAVSYFDKTFDMQKNGTGIGGFPSGERGKKVDPSFIFGSTGIALSLLAASTPVDPQWDRLMLLSF